MMYTWAEDPNWYEAANVAEGSGAYGTSVTPTFSSQLSKGSY